MAFESFFGSDPGTWFQNKDLEDISNAFGQSIAPAVMKSLQAYAKSLTPEGKMRLVDMFRARALADARQSAAYQSAGLMGQGFSPGYAKGLEANAYNSAQRATNAYRNKSLDPSQDLQTGLGVFGNLFQMRNPKSQGGSFLGDLFQIAGQVVPFLGPTGAAGAGASLLGGGRDGSSDYSGQSLFRM